VYLGPSLAVERAQQVLDADYRPPIRRGDIHALRKLASRPRIIGILDGEFFQSFAISPKEILPVIEDGVIVLGSSSMGALRAVELHPFGMIGVGRVFEMYHTREIEADDEVAMVFDRDTRRAHSVPMVNVRVALEAAREAGIITSGEERRLAQLVKNVYFPERTYSMMFKLARDERVLSEATASALREYLKSSAPDAKRDDGIRLLLEAKTIAARLESAAS
jgi:hypothetical protein